jgi:hypothetical protein
MIRRHMLLILLGYFLLKLSFLVARVVFIFKAVAKSTFLYLTNHMNVR